jgi:hypothetical protein
MESVLCCFVGCRQACCPTHFKTITIEQTGLLSFTVLGIPLSRGSAQKPQ